MPLRVVLFALRRESMFLLRLLPGARAVSSAPFPVWRYDAAHESLLILETGVGRQRTTRALQWLHSFPLAADGHISPVLVVAAGFAGGLDPALKVGDVVQASEIVDEAGETWPAAGVRSALPCGRLATVGHFVATPAEKAGLAKRLGARLADMESSAAATYCASAGWPFACVRSISDDAAASLSPHLVRLLSEGRVSFGKLACALVRRPWLIWPLCRLARGTRLAGRALAKEIARICQVGT